jgi:hypothetical protein
MLLGQLCPWVSYVPGSAMSLYVVLHRIVYYCTHGYIVCKVWLLYKVLCKILYIYWIYSIFYTHSPATLYIAYVYVCVGLKPEGWRGRGEASPLLKKVDTFS